MQVAQVSQGRLILFAHSAGKIWIVQVLVPRRLRHILQHAEAASNRPLPVRRKLLPFRQDIVLDVISLLRSQASPHTLALAQFLLLLR
jgi:hypothetical protein